MEIPIQQIWCDLADFTLVRPIFLHSDTANQPQLLHQSLDGLVVQGDITVSQFCRNAAVSISSFVFVIYGCDLRFGRFIFVLAVHPLQMVVEGCPGQLSDRKKNIQRMSLP